LGVHGNFQQMAYRVKFLQNQELQPHLYVD
jgi:hypothetical protein